MKIIVGLLVLLAAAAGYAAWTFRESATETDARLSKALSEEKGRTASLQQETERLRNAAREKETARTAALQEIERLQNAVKEGETARTASVAEAGEKARSLQGEIERLRGALKEAEAGGSDAGGRASVLSEILAAYYALDTALDGGLRPAYRATLQAQQEFAASPDDARFDGFGTSVKALQEAVAQALKSAETIRARLEKGAPVLDAAKLPRDGLARILDAKVAVWKGIGAAADATAKSMRRSACAILSNEEWQGAEIDVRAGEIVAVAATGKWRWGVSLGNAVGPEGENGDPDYRVVSDFGNGALLARIRGSERIHRGVPLIEPDREGKVELRINDTAVRDNEGSLDVVTWVFAPFRPPE